MKIEIFKVDGNDLTVMLEGAPSLDEIELTVKRFYSITSPVKIRVREAHNNRLELTVVFVDPNKT